MRRKWIIVGTAVALPAAVAAWLVWRAYLAPLRVSEAAPGVLVASQPGGAEWAEVLRRRGIRTVVNLRGPRPDERWYRDEIAACRELSVAHEDVRIKLDDWPPQHEVRRYVRLLGDSARPLLLHCKDGVDRSGWGSAVALALAGAPLDRALDAISWTSGHFCIPSRCPLHRFFARYRAWLAATGTGHSAEAFRHWALDVYCPPPYDAAVAILTEPLPRRVRAGDPVALAVRVTNRSDQAWRLRPGDARGIRLGARALGPYVEPPADALAIFRTPNNPARDLGRAGLVDGTITPGDERTFTLELKAPTEPGVWVVQVDMVDEHVHWFSDLGAPGVLLRLDVLAGAAS